MGILDKAKSSIKGYFDSKRENKAYREKLEKEARASERQIYEQEYRKAALKAAMLRARSDAEQKTGLAKLRAINQMHLHPGNPKSNFFSKLSEYTRSNKAKTEQNRNRTEALRKAGMNMKHSSYQRQNIAQKPRLY